MWTRKISRKRQAVGWKKQGQAGGGAVVARMKRRGRRLHERAVGSNWFGCGYGAMG